MRILIDLTSLADNFSGLERFALSVTQQLIKDKKIHYILVFKNNVYKDFNELNENVETIVIKGKNKLYFNQIVLPKAINRIKVDYYLFLAFPAPYFFNKQNSISAIHDLGAWDCPSTNKKHMIYYFKLLYRKCSKNNRKIITVSEFSKQRIIDILHVREENIIVAYDGLSDTFNQFTYSSNKNGEVIEKYKLPKKYILSLSTLEPRKNLQLLIMEYDRLLQDHAEYDLVLAGRRGWLVDDLLSKVTNETKKHIHFTGFIDEDDLPYIYKNAILFVFPSLYEGFGVPPIEAMSMGVPVVCSDSSSLPEVCGKAAEYFKNNDSNDLNRAIKYMLNNQSIMQEYSLIGLEQCKKFNWKNSAEKIKNTLM